MRRDGEPVPSSNPRYIDIRGRLRWMNDLLIEYIPARTRYAVGGIAVGASSYLVMSPEVAGIVTVLSTLIGFGIGSARDVKSRYRY